MPIDKKQLNLRQSFKFLLLQNPNYFGNLTELKGGKFAAAQQKKVEDRFFEELTCVSYNPSTQELSAVVRVKQTYGYSGGPCTDGSKEFVRFYLDYGDGTWVDEGAANFDAHDLPFQEPLCYAVKLRINPKKKACCDRTPVLPKVRAILSWNIEPPANQPGWLPVWGNRREAYIQIAPQTGLLCKLSGILDLKAADFAKLEKAGPSVFPPEPPTVLPEAQFLELKKIYGKKVEDHRLGHKALFTLASDPTDLLAFEQVKTLKGLGLDVSKIADFLLQPKFNTSYEELKCVGLDRDASVLHASIHVKRPFGYSGDLCHSGSREYVAFYLDFGAGWEYMGTTSVGVHDISQIPKDGLSYLATLPVSLTKHQKKWCEAGLARIRGILSWAVPPVPDDPDHVAHWGDWEDCHIEIRPLPKGVPQGELVPIIESIGSMPVNLIDASGYATGTNPVGLTAYQSPFDGNILITGLIANAPNSSDAAVARVRYRLMIKAPSSSTAQPWTRKFRIDVTTISGGVPGPQIAVTQIPDADGWVEYYPDYVPPDIVSVDRGILGLFRPSEEGLHEIHVEVDDPSSILPIVSATRKFRVDMTWPDVDVEITSGVGNCGTFEKGDIIEGTFSISDDHCLSAILSVTPVPETHGAHPEIGGAGGPASLSYTAGTLPGAGAAGTWRLDTGPMDPCGYNIRIRGEDRTIVNSSTIGHVRWDIEGFCLA